MHREDRDFVDAKAQAAEAALKRARDAMGTVEDELVALGNFFEETESGTVEEWDALIDRAFGVWSEIGACATQLKDLKDGELA